MALTASAQSNTDFNCASTRATDGRPVVVSDDVGRDARTRSHSCEDHVMSPIVLWHGFGPPASEQALMEALPLDEVPAVKVYLGLPMFGSRAPAERCE